MGVHKFYESVAQADVVGLIGALAAKADLSSGLLSTAQIPLVLYPPVTVTYAASTTINPTLGNNFQITATGNITTLTISTTGAQNGQQITLVILASGGARTITLAGATALTTGLTAATTIASTKLGLWTLRYSTLNSAWLLLGQTVGL